MPSTTAFMSLNDDCIFAIFNWCSREDLSSIQQTNRRLQTLEFIHFLHGNQSTWMIVSQTDFKDVEIEAVLSPNRNYPRFCKRFIKHICIELPTDEPTKKLTSFISTNFNDQHLKTIKFTNGTLANRFGYRIENILNNVERVIFNECHVTGNYYDNILKYCHSLRHLSVDWSYTYSEYNKDKFLLQTYPKLEHFQCHLYTEFDMDHWTAFLKLNPSFKTLTLYFIDGEEQHTIECIERIVDHAIHIERLFISFEGHYDFRSIFRNLQTLNTDRVKHLELRFTGVASAIAFNTHGKMLESVKILKGLHIIEPNHYIMFPSLVHLKILQLSSVASNNEIDAITLQINNWPSLEELHCTNSDFRCIVIVFLNTFSRQYEIRQKCSLKSYSNYQYNSFAGKVIYKKKVEFEYDCHNEINPFIYHVMKK